MFSKWLSSYIDCEAEIRSLFPFNMSDTFFSRDICTVKRSAVCRKNRLISVIHRAKSFLRRTVCWQTPPTRLHKKFIECGAICIRWNSERICHRRVMSLRRLRREFVTRGINSFSFSQPTQLSFKFSHTSTQRLKLLLDSATLRNFKKKNKKKY